MKWILFGPELYYLVVVIVFLFLAMMKPFDARRTHLTALIFAALGVGVSVAAVRLAGGLFLETYQVDLFSQVFKSMLCMGLFLVICICTDLSGVEPRRHGEFYLLLFTCTLAMMMLVSAVHLLTIYVALELSSYSLYILVTLRKGRNMGVEAGIKYFLIGITASAVMLFGLALLYSTIQATYVKDIIELLPRFIEQPLVIIGLLLTLCGFFFKLAVFPFHFWVPDVYQGAANQVAAYIATASKVAAIAILIRMVALSGGSSLYLVHVLVTLSIISMTVGNLAAIVQKDLKRLLAYSSVAHAGYVLIGILSMTSNGYAAAIFYALAVLVMKFTSFLVVVMVAYDGSNLEITQLAGLHRRSPILAMALMLSAFSLAGIPPTIGFTGKLLIFTAAMEQGYFVLVLIAMINVVISLYYYLLVVKAAYMLEPSEELPAYQISPSIKALAGSLIVVTVVSGIFPQHLIALAEAAARVLM
jgi:NADH-quinone oxidoreductase subunit N